MSTDTQPAGAPASDAGTTSGAADSAAPSQPPADTAAGTPAKTGDAAPAAPAAAAAPVTTPAADSEPGFAVTFPEAMQEDKEFATALETAFKEKAPQKLVDFLAERSKAAEAEVEQQKTQLLKAMQEEAAKDPEIGGAKKADTDELVKRALQVVSPKLAEVLNQTGLIHNVEVRRHLAGLAKDHAEDTIAGSTSPGTPVQSREEKAKAFYDRLNAQRAQATR